MCICSQYDRGVQESFRGLATEVQMMLGAIKLVVKMYVCCMVALNRLTNKIPWEGFPWWWWWWGMSYSKPFQRRWAPTGWEVQELMTDFFWIWVSLHQPEERGEKIIQKSIEYVQLRFHIQTNHMVSGTVVECSFTQLNL